MICRALGPGFILLAGLTWAGGGALAADNPVALVQFQVSMARKIGEVCDDFGFDESGYRAYLAEMAENAGSDLGAFTARVEANPSAEALVPHYEAFILRHEGALFSSRPAFCRAGAREAGEGTGIGRMLKVTGE